MSSTTVIAVGSVPPVRWVNFQSNHVSLYKLCSDENHCCAVQEVRVARGLEGPGQIHKVGPIIWIVLGGGLGVCLQGI